MSRFVRALLIISVFCCALAATDELVVTSEFGEEQPLEDKLLANIVRARNLSKTPYSKGNGNVEENDKISGKQLRSTNHRAESESRDNCCGSRYSSNSSTRPDSYYNRAPVDSGRYPSKFGERLPTDRYGWQTQGQPPGLNGSTGKPGSGSYAGTAFYEGNQAGDRYGFRPSYGNDGPRKPNGYDSNGSGGYGYGNGGYGGYVYNRPAGYGGSFGGGGYGISGTLANGDEFGPVEPSYPEGNAPSHPNIQAQKAVALKALAGVALIGAAAALATNPVLLPLGVVSGRRKRSSMPIKGKDAYMDSILTILRSEATKNYNDKDENKMTLSPTCIARLTCEIQNYWLKHRKDVEFFKGKPVLERHLMNLISNNMPNEDLASTRIQKLLKAATIVASNGGNCNTFTCTFQKTKGTKNSSILKL